MKPVIDRFLPKDDESFFLFGPRGTGKTTWLRSNMPDAFTVNLLDADVFLRYSSNPMHLKDVVEGNPNKRVFVVDEIQKVPCLRGGDGI